ncbi:MAG: DUF1634 domain-containing protein [Candidatus Omnitrophica bacterium]|nr:DUF1634 domain-containing protein [Candidatus Omnitrophota bacterium]
MRRSARVKWIADFDLEALMSAILRSGTLLSIGLVLVGIALRSAQEGFRGFAEPLRGTNVFQFLRADLRLLHAPERWPVALAHLGVAALMLTPYVRVLATMLYVTCVQRSGKHAILASLVLLTLTYIVFLG